MSLESRSFALKKITLLKVIFSVLALLCLSPWVQAAGALALGIGFALAFGNPFSEFAKRWTHQLLSLSVIGLGAGMDLNVVGHVGLRGVGYTVLGILGALFFGSLFGKWLKTSRDTSLLISVGTAICGGSAIAAVAPVIKAKHHEVTVALATVFCLNALALLLFPWLGHLGSFSENQFGLWSALAIHDTSSVVGATLQYGPQALQVGTTVKLARALWIVPVAFVIGWVRSRNISDPGTAGKERKPWFILGFLLAAALVTYVPDLRESGHAVEVLARHVLILTLFFIGSNLSRETLKAVGFRPFLQGALLWVLVASSSFILIQWGWIQI